MTKRSTARLLRRSSTDAERILWRYLRNRQLAGLKFRRQEPVGPFIADFLCFKHLLIVDLDGGQHARKHVKDAERTA